MTADPLTNPAFVIFSALLPILIALVKQEGFTEQQNTLIALACYVFTGLLAVPFSGLAFTLENVVAMISVATVVGSAAYNLFWAQLGSPSIEARIMRATSFLKAA